MQLRIHLDTDLGGDIDDLCALAMVLRWPGVEITGITTTAELEGKRAGYVRHVLGLVGREDVPVAAGADVSLGRLRYEQNLLDEGRYWGAPIAPAPGPLERALALLEAAVEQGATLIAIGPFTNLHLLEERHPGILAGVPLVLMGGYVYPPREGFPQWGNDSDYNVQADARAAQYVMEHSSPTLVPLTVSVETALRRAYLPRLRKAGPLGQLLAAQAEAFAVDEGMEEKYGRTCPALPTDTINFQHDPLACAIALGWSEGVEMRETPLRVQMKDGWLHEVEDPTGRPLRLVTRVDGGRFSQFWLETIAGRHSQT